MAKRGRFGSFMVYLVGLLVVGGAALVGLHLWQQKDADLVAARQAMAEGSGARSRRAGGEYCAGAEGATDHAAR